MPHAAAALLLHARMASLRDERRAPRPAAASRCGTRAQAVRRMLAGLPATAQALCASPYLDAHLFAFDDKLITAAQRPRPYSEQPLKFASRAFPEHSRFKARCCASVAPSVPRSPRVGAYRASIGGTTCDLTAQRQSSVLWRGCDRLPCRSVEQFRALGCRCSPAAWSPPAAGRAASRWCRTTSTRCCRSSSACCTRSRRRCRSASRCGPDAACGAVLLQRQAAEQVASVVECARMRMHDMAAGYRATAKHFGDTAHSVKLHPDRASSFLLVTKFAEQP